MPRRRRQEAGVAMLVAIMVAIILATVIGVIVTTQMSQFGSSRRVTERTSSLDVAGAGVQAIQQALVAGRNPDVPGARQADGFVAGPTDVSDAAAVVGGDLIDTSSARYRDVDTQFGGSVKTVRGPVTGSSRQMWQVVQALPPTGAQPWLTLYVRGWTETGDAATDAAVVKARLKPGSMADYQLLSDMPIYLADRASITGRVHSNGATDEWSQVPKEDMNLRVWSDIPVTCTTGQGGTPVVSTARGNISLNGGTGCIIQASNGNYVPLDVARDAVARMRSRCVGSSDVRCFKSSDTSTTPARAVISAESVEVTYPGQAPVKVGTPAGSTHAIVFDRDVEVVGTTSARLTIAAWSDGVANRGAPSITIVGNVGRTAPGVETPRALGLLAENDIVVDPTGPTYPSQITAALYASAGGVRIPWRYRTPVPVTEPVNFYPPLRDSLTVVGSVTSHASIALHWSWGSIAAVGYDSRTYLWDSWLATYAPPFWPAINAWEIIDQSEANADCYGASAVASMQGGPSCR